ncbi:MAG: hypothetical protein RL492_1144, partial [Verrucomicrobiota bacterium]
MSMILTDYKGANLFDELVGWRQSNAARTASTRT